MSNLPEKHKPKDDLANKGGNLEKAAAFSKFYIGSKFIRIISKIADILIAIILGIAAFFIISHFNIGRTGSMIVLVIAAIIWLVFSFVIFDKIADFIRKKMDEK